MIYEYEWHALIENYRDITRYYAEGVVTTAAAAGGAQPLTAVVASAASAARCSITRL